jgi:hypothetical protein
MARGARAPTRSRRCGPRSASRSRRTPGWKHAPFAYPHTSIPSTTSAQTLQTTLHRAAPRNRRGRDAVDNSLIAGAFREIGFECSKCIPRRPRRQENAPPLPFTLDAPQSLQQPAARSQVTDYPELSAKLGSNVQNAFCARRPTQKKKLGSNVQNALCGRRCLQARACAAPNRVARMRLT